MSKTVYERVRVWTSGRSILVQNFSKSHLTIFFVASCVECFDKMENVVESCNKFSKTINCELNTTTKECEETKVSVVKYCSSKECQGDKDILILCLTLKQYYKSEN